MARHGVTLALLALLAVLVADLCSDRVLALSHEQVQQKEQEQGGGAEERAGVSVDAGEGAGEADDGICAAEDEESGGGGGRAPATWVLPAAKRVVAIGDLHGDLAKARRALALAGLVDPETLDWVGGETVAVQVRTLALSYLSPPLPLFSLPG